MALVSIIAYACVYFAGYYGAYALNLIARRVLVSNLRVAGLGLLALSSFAAAYVIQEQAPKNAETYLVGELQGQYAIGPAFMVAAIVAVRWWLEVRKASRAGNA